MRCIHKGFPFIVSVALLLFAVCVGVEPAVVQAQTEQAITTTIQSKIRGPLPMAEPGQKEVSGVRAVDIVTEAGRFHITSGTKVVRGKKLISMDDLAVPCEARIVYQPLRRNDPNALKIEVKKILAGATKKWAKPEAQ